MTKLLIGAIVLIMVSALALLLGWLGANETFIWISITASVGAAGCLALAFRASRGLSRTAPQTKQKG